MSYALSNRLNQNLQNSLSNNIFEQEMHQIFEDDDIPSTIIATPGGRFAKRDPESGQIEWIADQTFSSPVAFAIEDSGKSIGVHIIPDAPVSSLFSEEYLITELDRQNDVDRDNVSAAFDDETVFGSLQNGELFAIPLGRKSKRMISSGRNGLPHVPRLSSTIGSTKALPAKLPHVSSHGDLLSAMKESSALTTVLKSSPCDQYSTNFAECLRSTYGALLETLDDAPYEDQIAAVDIFNDFQRKKGRKFGKSNFVRIMTSWLPPVVALIFVLSFELGRREKARVIAQESSTASITFKRELSDEDLKSRNDRNGVINVSEQVLGYGGHGTVVYKGKLDGRFVAVKRMLKAYHASADREISLLIESDGHPNVVRYFLKEIRGDFVYLALELCDMSLQDLIVALSKYRVKMQVEDSNVIHNSTRKILFEIASGVKHIHSLRIVHRDLKPANILVARKYRKQKSKMSLGVDEDEMYQACEAGEYVPKISDMGLGKQLTGQSSFGFSTFNSMGPDLMGNDTSTIAGAGPGSVGWQAPEVMAQRLTPESFLEDSSGPESWLEASPIDASLNVRTSRSVDIFSLGCIFYCTLLPGSHPFGQWYEREANIMKGNTSTDALKEISMEAWDLVNSMLSRNPSARPTAAQICSHPFFWSPAKRLPFLCEFSDRLETDVDKIPSSTQFMDKVIIERQASRIVGTSWDTKIDSRLLNNVQKFRSYDTSSVRDCLRLLRNKHHHYDELPSDLKDSVIPTQGSLLQYFEERFPNLLYHCYSICRDNLARDDPLVVKYDIVICKRGTSRFSMENTKQNNDRPYSCSSVSCSDPIKMNESKDSATITMVEEERNDFEIKVTELKQDVDSLVNGESHHDDSESSNVGTTHHQHLQYTDVSKDIIVWQSSSVSASLNCRGWTRSEDEWVRRTNEKPRKIDPNLVRCIEDPKYRTRLCNHWENSNGVYCPMLKKHKCIFAHSPAELRVKDGKRGRWGKLVDVHGNANNRFHSGGEDTYGAAKSIESARKEEGKWKPPSMGKKKKHLNQKKE
jgi:serine/threonine protein kinase